MKTSGIVTWHPCKGLYLAWRLFRSRHYTYSMKICPVELVEVCREETSLGRPLADPLPRGGRQLANPLPRGDQGGLLTPDLGKLSRADLHTLSIVA